MWCPKCKSEYRDGVEICPVCSVPLTENLTEETDPAASVTIEPEYLMSFQDLTELAMAKEILTRAEIPFLCKVPGSGEYLQIVTGANMFGTDLYVEKGYTHRALRVLRQFDRADQQPFNSEELDAAIAAYQEQNPAAEEQGGEETPVSPEGYRIVWIFLAVFAVLAILAFAMRR